MVNEYEPNDTGSAEPGNPSVEGADGTDAPGSAVPNSVPDSSGATGTQGEAVRSETVEGGTVEEGTSLPWVDVAPDEVNAEESNPPAAERGTPVEKGDLIHYE